MLIKVETLQKIVAGEIDLVFRKWKRPTVKKGGTLKTAVGVLEILAVDEIAEDQITKRAARRAGFASLDDATAELAKREGTLFRIRVKYAGEDPRIALRQKRLTKADLTEISERLDRLDRASKRGAWTRDVLETIRDNPGVRAPDLAEAHGLETKVFKTNVRKLKALGLTVSLRIGYELSPRGAAYVKRAR